MAFINTADRTIFWMDRSINICCDIECNIFYKETSRAEVTPQSRLYYKEFIAHLKSEIKNHEEHLKFFKEELQTAENDFRSNKEFSEGKR